MKTVVGMGLNRTGIATSPLEAKEQIEAAARALPTAPADGTALARVRSEYVREAEPVGTVPPPASLEGIAKAAAKILTGKPVDILLDKLSERVAFERSGVRMYEALLVKIEVEGAPDGVSPYEVGLFRDHEKKHGELATLAIEQLGGDPTAQTPMADINGVIGLGLLQVLDDPRTTVVQSLHAIHRAELTDTDEWGFLIALARKVGQPEMAASFEIAQRNEEEHLSAVRRWIRANIIGEDVAA